MPARPALWGRGSATTSPTRPLVAPRRSTAVREEASLADRPGAAQPFVRLRPAPCHSARVFDADRHSNFLIAYRHRFANLPQRPETPLTPKHGCLIARGQYSAPVDIPNLAKRLLCLFVLEHDEALRARTLGAAHRVPVISEFELRVILKSRESVGDLRRNGVGFGLRRRPSLQPLLEDLFREVVADGSAKRVSAFSPRPLASLVSSMAIPCLSPVACPVSSATGRRRCPAVCRCPARIVQPRRLRCGIGLALLNRFPSGSAEDITGIWPLSLLSSSGAAQGRRSGFHDRRDRLPPEEYCCSAAVSAGCYSA